MRTLVVVLIAVVAFASGTMLGFKLDDSDADASVPTTTGGLPAAVEQTRARLLEAAETGDYEALRELIPDSGFKYTFGDAVDDGPIAYWQELERTTEQRPIAQLAAVLCRIAGWSARNNTTAGREDRVRLVGDRLHDDFAADAVCLADPPDDDERGRRHRAEGYASSGLDSATGTAAACSLLARRVS